MSDMIFRIDGEATVVKASAIDTVDDLALAMGFLANHFLYKMSKDDGEVRMNAAKAVFKAFAQAEIRFGEEVLDRLEPTPSMPDAISNLGMGKIENPYHLV